MCHRVTRLAVALPVEMNVEDDEDDADYQTPSHQSQRSSSVRTPCTGTSDTCLQVRKEKIGGEILAEISRERCVQYCISEKGQTLYSHVLGVCA